MAVDERARRALYDRLEAVIGMDEATTLIEYLPPVGWADVATKRDVDELRVATKHDLDGVRVGLDQLRRDMAAGFEHQTEKITSALRGELNRVLIAAFTLITGLVIALVRFS